MSNDLAIQIRLSLSQYLAEELTLKQFLRRYLPVLATASTDGPADELVHEIYVRIAEYTNGDWTEAELREILAPIVRTYVVAWPDQGPRVQTGTSTSTMQATSMPSVQLVGV